MEEKQNIKGKTITVAFRKGDILEILDNADWNQPDTLEIIKEDTSLIRKIIDAEANPQALLIHVPDRHTSKEILSHFQEVETREIARAMLIKSFAGRIMGNLYLKLFGGKPNEAGRIVPVKLFTNTREAIEWLLIQQKLHKK